MAILVYKKNIIFKYINFVNELNLSIIKKSNIFFLKMKKKKIFKNNHFK